MIPYDPKFCRKHCPYMRECAGESTSMRMTSYSGYMFGKLLYQVDFSVWCPSLKRKFPSCIMISTFDRDEMAFYDNKIYEYRSKKHVFLKKHVDMEEMAKSCPVYTEMMIWAINQDKKHGADAHDPPRDA